ncbi:MAG: glutamine--fructose-6-phosphate transaminase (isomerizing) [Halobacteriota archaeon]|uniref:glutamine--fructose-6-phosphate transaminase (isomerizing) n=1 Tax=Natronomonas sp. TaxID=2184060 RepID=UPI0039763554
MCGIVACIDRNGRKGAVGTLMTGLHNLEYRGYDSAGIAVKNGHGLNVIKREGAIDALDDAIGARTPEGTVGIGHTRWSTHGPPSDENAHPHTSCDGRVAVVHNGIIDNYEALKTALPDHEFTSETDSEVAAHLIEVALAAEYDPEDAFREAVERLSGSYALAAVFDDGDTIYATRNGSPLVLGRSSEGYYLASDVPAFREFTDEVVYLHDDDIVAIDPDGYEITDLDGESISRPVETVEWDAEAAGRGGYDHYMLKEIYEQPTALRGAIRGRTDTLSGRVDIEELPMGSLGGVERVQLVAMGTSYHAAMYAESLLTDRGVQAQTYLSGEYATAPPPLDDRTLVVAVTQSGETADTLSAIRSIQGTGARTLAVTNVVGSTITRECDDTVTIRAGPEIGVAATKSFSSQVAVLGLLAERIAVDTAASGGTTDAFLEAVGDLPTNVQRVLDTSDAASVAETYHGSDAYFFLGRSVGHAVACEGALKFKEITYEHAEGFSAAELKHGPLALVTPETPVFVVFTGRNDTKTLHNAKEVSARGAPVVAIASDPGSDIAGVADAVLSVPETIPELRGVLANVQLQLLSYHAANRLGRPIDKPRNLAKSVTVE